MHCMTVSCTGKTCSDILIKHHEKGRCEKLHQSLEYVANFISGGGMCCLKCNISISQRYIRIQWHVATRIYSALNAMICAGDNRNVMSMVLSILQYCSPDDIRYHPIFSERTELEKELNVKCSVTQNTAFFERICQTILPLTRGNQMPVCPLSQNESISSCSCHCIP